MIKKERLPKLLWTIGLIFATVAILIGSNANSKDISYETGVSNDSIELAAARAKLASLEKAVSDAKAKGINTSYEDITVTTASLFLKTYIPWDMANPAELASAFSRWSKKQDLKGTPQQEAARTPEWELKQTSDINEYGKTNNSSQLEFISGANKLEVVAPPILLGQIEALMSKTTVKRPLRCIDNNAGRQTAFGVMCRSVEYEGGHLVCLINVAAVPKEVSLELNGKPVTTAMDLFENKVGKDQTIKIEPLEVRLLQVSK